MALKPLRVKLLEEGPWCVARIEGVLSLYCENCEAYKPIPENRLLKWNCKCKEPVIVPNALFPGTLDKPIERLLAKEDEVLFETYPTCQSEAMEAAKSMIEQYGQGPAILIQLFRVIHELKRLQEMK